ncbi:ribulose-phosphate 3-epimerase [Vairimorpha necatrix]|uniref:Ribulose-phosphate 3-epimerase n=1 Tax=Vairimorpha necatrix TaxID=6039 RepID=A0AAX4J9C8_9MICR
MIYISILDCDLLNLNHTLKELKSNNISHLHLDILDTSFVPNISFGPSIINKVLEYDFIFDLHLMVASPITILDLINLQKVDTVFVHFEIKNLSDTLKFLKNKNKKIGLAISPDTTVEDVCMDDIISKILIMTVYPGFGNQKFIKECVKKIKNIDRAKIEVGVDGGINLDTIEDVKDFDFVIIGSSYFKVSDKKKFIETIQKYIKK